MFPGVVADSLAALRHLVFDTGRVEGAVERSLGVGPPALLVDVFGAAPDPLPLDVAGDG